ncbi:MAG TPA: hypothetical protein VES73_05420 [Lamprocystis sp. (in: g-proteobacteria)]|nr:hypothetical protein [Lamprocystis sp. (in: g-proteobacteria)]
MTGAWRHPRWGRWRRAVAPGLLLGFGLWNAPLPAMAQAGAQTPPPKAIDPIDLGRWVSRMWRPVGAVAGHLNDEQRESVVVVLHRRDALPDATLLPVGSRGLAIFSLGADGVYRREALAEDLLPCVQCLGTVNRDPNAAPFEIDIEGRQLILSWTGNDDGFVFVRLVIAWDLREQAFGLIADEIVRADRLGKIQAQRRRDFQAGRAVTDGEVTEFAPRFVPIETVKATDYR